MRLLAELTFRCGAPGTDAGVQTYGDYVEVLRGQMEQADMARQHLAAATK